MADASSSQHIPVRRDWYRALNPELRRPPTFPTESLPPMSERNNLPRHPSADLCAPLRKILRSVRVKLKLLSAHAHLAGGRRPSGPEGCVRPTLAGPRVSREDHQPALPSQELRLSGNS